VAYNNEFRICGTNNEIDCHKEISSRNRANVGFGYETSLHGRTASLPPARAVARLMNPPPALSPEGVGHPRFTPSEPHNEGGLSALVIYLGPVDRPSADSFLIGCVSAIVLNSG
jgi:hypothetical protein